MGKIKRKRLKVSRYSPTNVHNNGKVREVFNSEVDKIKTRNYVEDSNSDTFQTLKNGISHNPKGGLKAALEKVTGPITEEKIMGLNMLAAFALELRAAKFIVEDKMVSFIAPLLRDESCQVRLAASGTLRNLCSWESDEIVDMMIQQDVMEPLSQLLKSYEGNAPCPEVARQFPLTYSKGVAHSMEESDSHNLIFVHATNVLWSLCECNEEALQIFNHENLVNILLKHIDPYVWNYTISLAAADCLLCVSEDNTKISSSLLPMEKTLHSLAVKAVSDNCGAIGLHYAIAITGILFNVGYWVSEDLHFGRIFEILRKVLEIDATSLQLSHIESSSKAADQESFDHTISAQLIALEVLSNICCPDEEEESYSQFEESYEEHNMNFEDEPMDLETDIQRDITNNLPIEVLEGIKYHQLASKIIEKFTEPPLEANKGFGEEQKTNREKLNQVQIRSLQCFQNIISSLPIEDVGGPQKLFSVWQQLGQISFSNSDQTEVLADSSSLEAISGALRAIIDKLSEHQFEQLLQITPNDLQPVFRTIVSCEVSAVKANLCRMIGTYGCSLVKHAPDDQPFSMEVSSLLTSITDALLKVSQGDISIWVRAEALDVLIDLYSDDKTDQVASRINLVDSLKSIHPQFKAKFNQQKRTLGDHRPLVLTVRDNLVAFIKYKASRTCKYLK